MSPTAVDPGRSRSTLSIRSTGERAGERICILLQFVCYVRDRCGALQPFAQLAGGRLRSWSLDVDFLALTADAASWSMVRRTHERGMKIHAWTIDDPVQMWVMMSRGVDGIITNRVELAHHVKKMRAQMTPVGRFIIWMAGEAGLLSGMEKSSMRDDA